MAKYFIVRDSREQSGYISLLKKRTHRAKLATADYVIMTDIEKKEKYTDEDVHNCGGGMCIERKKTTSELMGNFTAKSGAFWREIERMSKYKRAVLLLEFSEADLAKYPNGPSGIPKYKRKYIRVSPKYGFSCIKKIEDLGIEVVFAGNRAGARKFIEGVILEHIDSM